MALRGLPRHLDALPSNGVSRDPSSGDEGQVRLLLDRVAAAGGRRRELQPHKAWELGRSAAALAALDRGEGAALADDRGPGPAHRH